MTKPFSSALVVEGGALRGIHTAGVMDVLMRYNIYFPYVIGVSAGALNAYNYIAHQKGRSAKILLEYIRDPRYLDLKAIPRQKQSAFDFDFMFHGLQEFLPFDEQTFRSTDQEFVVVATDVQTGEPVYFHKSTCSDIFKAGAASASLPLISPPVELDGFRCIDGGVADPIPFLHAMQESDKTVVLLTRHKGFRKRTMPFAERETARRLYKNSPQMLEAALRANDHYNDTLDLLEQMEDAGEIFVIRPRKEIDISLLERNTENLGALYADGILDGEAIVDALSDYLGITNGMLQFASDPALRMRKYRIDKYADEQTLERRVEKAASLGEKPTGSDAHNKLTQYIRQQLMQMELPVYSDPHCFSAQHSLSIRLSLNDGVQTTDIPCVSVPYTAFGGERTVEAELCFVRDPNYRFLNARGKIAVLHLKAADLQGLIGFEPIVVRPPELTVPPYCGVSARADSFAFLSLAKMAGVRGLICVWDEADEVPPFYLPYAQRATEIPCVWIGAKDGELLDALRIGEIPQTAVMTVQSDVVPFALCETVYTVLPGRGDRGESVIVHTHTDGVNAMNENGFAALLTLLHALRDKPLQRTHIFVFSAGRLRLPIIKTSVSDGSGSIQKWLMMHGDLWDGKAGHLRAAASLSAEHLGDAALPEIVFSSNAALDGVYLRSIEPRHNLKTILLRAYSGIYGEGQPMHAAGIPTLAFAAEDLSAYQTDVSADRFSAAFALEQMQAMLDCLTMLDDMPRESIGRCEKRPPLSTMLPIHSGKGESE